MRHLDRVKLVLAVLGLMSFFLSVRTGIDTLRWVGIGLLAIAYGLRFLRRPPTDSDAQLPSEMR